MFVCVFCMSIHWIEVVVSQLKRVIVAEFTQDSPGGLMTSPLDKESVQEQETYKTHVWSNVRKSIINRVNIRVCMNVCDVCYR